MLVKSVNVVFPGNSKRYAFRTNMDLKIGDEVMCITSRGKVKGTVKEVFSTIKPTASAWIAHRIKKERVTEMKVGEGCFVRGAIGRIVGENGPEHWIVVFNEKVTDDVQFNLGPISCSIHEAIMISKDACEPICSNIFKIGDKIESLLSSGKNSFKGTVTGFEVTANRVVCISDKIDNYEENRTRYAYKVSEIKKYDADEWYFNTGKKYKLNGNQVVIVALNAKRENSVMLITEDFTVLHTDVPKVTKKSVLENYYGISSIEYLGNINE